MLQVLPLVLALAVGVAEVPNPRPRGAWITDLADVLGADAEARLNARIERLERDVGVEIAVVTVQDVEGTPRDFATALFNRWGVGKSRADNGLLVLLVMGQRRLEMETGYGLEPILPDGWLGSMQNERMVPAFKRGDFGGGLEAGVGAIDERLRQNATEAAEGTRRPGAPRPAGQPGDTTSLLVGLGLIVVLPAGLLVWLGVFLHRRRRTCPKCKIRMGMLDERADDAHLSEGQRAEEKLGSVDYQVFVCGQCQFSRTLANNRWFSGFSGCRQCSFRTLATSSTTMVAATYDHGGEIRVDERCGHCGYRNTYTRHTARLTRPSSSSSSSSSWGSSSGSRSSGGSFGGGRSGGGGAGSSW